MAQEAINEVLRCAVIKCPYCDRRMPRGGAMASHIHHRHRWSVHAVFRNNIFVQLAVYGKVVGFQLQLCDRR